MTRLGETAYAVPDAVSTPTNAAAVSNARRMRPLTTETPLPSIPLGLSSRGGRGRIPPRRMWQEPLTERLVGFATTWLRSNRHLRPRPPRAPDRGRTPPPSPASGAP